ncbi:MAG: aminodeoxychorismate synthase component I [Nitrospirae bacterium]|nr:aminodeoxychorismate synthase component I [Nitrospirota bacterium]
MHSIPWRGSAADLFERLAPLNPAVFVRRPELVFAGFHATDVFRFDSRLSDENPLKALQEWVDRRFTDELGPHLAAGYISYDLKNLLGDFRRRPGYTPLYPEMTFLHFEEGLYADLHKGEILIRTSSPAERNRLRDLLSATPSASEMVPAAPSSVEFPPFPVYAKKIARLKEYFRAGDLYQANLTERLRFRYPGQPARLFARLLECSDAPWACWMQDGPLCILSASPEHFVMARDGVIRSRPVKGTRPATGEAEEDERARRELASSEKDRAEHVMIVDVVRHDLGRICRAGTVSVEEPMRIDSFPTVHHMVSTVRGALRSEVTISEILGAVFPGASITGAPKIRATEIIDEMEDSPRGIYTGALGIIGSRRDLDLGMAIRTLTLLNGDAVYGTGGGITIDSDARSEYEECSSKTQVLIQALFGKAVSDDREEGSRLLPQRSVRPSV